LQLLIAPSQRSKPDPQHSSGLHPVLAGNDTWILECGKNKPPFMVRFKKISPEAL